MRPCITTTHDDNDQICFVVIFNQMCGLTHPFSAGKNTFSNTKQLVRKHELSIAVLYRRAFEV